MTGGVGWLVQKQISAASGVADIDVDDYLKKGFVMNPMGVSGQSGAWNFPIALNKWYSLFPSLSFRPVSIDLACSDAQAKASQRLECRLRVVTCAV
jgi:hypothetical protein